MTADALNSMERRIGEDIADLKHDVADLKHDVHRLDVKIDVQHRATDEKLDRGFRQILEHTDQTLDRGFRQILEHLEKR